MKIMKNHLHEVLKKYSSSQNHNNLSQEKIPEGKVVVIAGNRNCIIITNYCKAITIESDMTRVKEGN